MKVCDFGLLPREMRNSGAAMRKLHGLAAAEKQVQEGCTPPLHAGVRYAAGRRGGEGILSRGGEFVGAWVKLLQTRAGGGDGGKGSAGLF